MGQILPMSVMRMCQEAEVVEAKMRLVQDHIDALDGADEPASYTELLQAKQSLAMQSAILTVGASIVSALERQRE